MEKLQVCPTSFGGFPNSWAVGWLLAFSPSFAFDHGGGGWGTRLVAEFVPVLPLQVNAQGQVYGTEVTAALVTKPMPFQTTPQSGTCDYTLPQSAHTGVMIVALGDGSVRSISPSISQYTFWSAVTPSGGEVLGPDW